jgi:ABC-2 type transport system ATP-binding protein
MDEAERLCDRVGIVDQGRLIALDSPSGLIARLGGEHHIEFTLNESGSAVDLPWSGLPGVVSASHRDGVHTLTVTETHVAIPPLLALLHQRGWTLARLTTRHVSLEDVFVALTGRRISADDADDHSRTPNGM